MRFKELKLEHRVLAAVIVPLSVFAVAMVALNQVRFRQTLMEEKQAQVRATIDVAYSIVDAFHQAARAGKMTEEQAKEEAKAKLKQVRYGVDGDDYVFINQGTLMVMHPMKPELDGKDVGGLQDKNGLHLFSEFAKVAAEKGKGFVSYYWADKKDPNRSVPKLTYVRSFAPWNWILGTGIYIEEIDRQAQSDLINSLLLIGGAFFALALIFFFWIRNSVSRPIEALAERLEGVSHRILGTADSARQGAEVVSSSSMEQVSSIEETSTALEEVNSMIEHNVASAQKAFEVSEKLRGIADGGGDSMKRLNEAMSRIEASTAQVTELSKVIEQIGEKIQIMDEIAFQTSLLSFNASVEASRAGEHGRGFSIVAEEMGALADQSSQAAAEVNDIIRESSKTAQRIVDENRKRVQEGGVQVKEVSTALEQIREGTRSVTDRSGEVLKASKEQLAGVEQINSAMHLIDQAAQRNSGSAQQTSDAAKELHGETEEMDELVTRLLTLVHGKDSALKLREQGATSSSDEVFEEIRNAA